jgi:phosphoribosylformylglycinamidine cyclo-ligase
MPDPRDSISYADAGVNLDAANELTARLKDVVESTKTAGASGEFGAFGGRFHIPEASDLVASADGVGTKVLVAARSGRHDTVGIDLVNHCVNDILVEGAEPLFFLDYFACGRLDPDVAEQVISGVAAGCRENGCALIGGETAEMPGVYEDGTYDLAGFIVGRRIWDVPGAEAVQSGARLIALASSGLHTNGYSLARRVLFDHLGLQPDDPFPGDERSVADVLLAVHRSYLPALRPALASGAVSAMAHITGGGIAGNLRRALPDDIDAFVDTSSWTPPIEFEVIGRESGMAPRDLYAALNMGVGLIAIAAPGAEAEIVQAARSAGIAAFDCGEVGAGSGDVTLVGL